MRSVASAYRSKCKERNVGNRKSKTGSTWWRHSGVEVEKAARRAWPPDHIASVNSIFSRSMHPSTNDWNKFMYSVGSWLRPRPSDPDLLEVFQPIPQEANEDWTDAFCTC